MHDQPKYTPYKPSDFFADQRSARPANRGHRRSAASCFEDELLHTGRIGGQPATVFPFPVDMAVMQRGRQRYDIYCSPCHGLTGEGDGMVVQRGYRRPPSFNVDRLRQAPPGHIYDVITNGFGAMPDYAAQVPVRDRWAIVAYIRALQLSQYAGRGRIAAGRAGATPMTLLRTTGNEMVPELKTLQAKLFLRAASARRVCARRVAAESGAVRSIAAARLHVAAVDHAGIARARHGPSGLGRRLGGRHPPHTRRGDAARFRC